MKTITVEEIAFGRTGDKGNISNVLLLPYRGSDLELLADRLTVDRVREIYEPLVDGRIERYTFNGVLGLNYVMYDSLQGGVASSLCLDTHGKARHGLLLEAEIEVPDDYEPPKTVNGEKEWVR